MPQEIPEEDRDRFRELLRSIAEMTMPFGKYGPDNFPPRGVPLYDLPPEYLHWFKQKGFPRGKLGEMMALVYEAKVNGADAVFNEFRTKRGGRTDLREKRAVRRRHVFGDGEDPGSVDSGEAR